MTLPIIDAHCHLESYKQIDLKPGWLPITTGYSHSSNIKNAIIGTKYNVPYVLGIAPQSAIKEGVKNLGMWVEEIRKYTPKAIGEIGLDMHWAKNETDVKNEGIVFDRMLELAEEMKLPVVIHSRDAEGKVIDLLKERKWDRGIMMHFFSGTLAEAEKAVDLGALISISPLRSKERRKIINSLGVEDLLVETDSPYVVRTFYEVERAIEYVAEVKGLDKSIVAEQTAKNAIRLFNLEIDG